MHRFQPGSIKHVDCDVKANKPMILVPYTCTYCHGGIIATPHLPESSHHKYANLTFSNDRKKEPNNSLYL